MKACLLALLLTTSCFAQAVGTSGAIGISVASSGTPTINNLTNAAYCADTSVSANTITCSTAVSFTGYSAGQAVDVLLANTVTGATTINVNVLGAKAVTYNGTNALTSAIGWVAGATGRLQYDGTRFVLQGLVSSGGASPADPILGVQYKATSSTFGANSNFIFYPSTSAPAAPVLAIVGTPGAITYGYRLVFRTPTGASARSSETTIATGNAVLDGTNYVTVAVPACALSPNTTVDVYLTTTDPGSNVPDTGYLANIACGATYNHQGQDGNTVSPPTVDTTTGLDLNGTHISKGHVAFGNNAVLNAPDSGGFGGNNSLSVVETFADGLGNAGGLFELTYAPTTSATTQYGLSVVQTVDPTNTQSISFAGINSVLIRSSNGDTPFIQGVSAYMTLTGTGHSNSIQGFYAPIYIESRSVAALYGTSVGVTVNSGATIDNLWGYYYYKPNVNSSTVTDNFAYYAEDQGSANITNNYYSWFDSRGVLRTKEDSTFDSVGQAITALYNPQFAKYTPGAADFERLVEGRWNGNVAEIGTEKGGTGTLRNVRLIGTQVLVDSLKATGAATGKTVVCVDVATGQLYASSSGVACAN